MSEVETVDRLLTLFGLGDEFVSEYRKVWHLRCSRCGVADGLCLTGQGHQLPRPHYERRARRPTAHRKAPQ